MNHELQVGELRLSTHYYVLSLAEDTTRLYEAFRESLIDIENTWFPFGTSEGPARPALNDAQLQTHLQTIDRHFSHYYEHEPLGVVLAGSDRHRAAFTALTAHPGLIIGDLEGDHSKTSMDDLGQIAWPIVREAIATAGRRVTRKLEEAERASNLVAGIDAVVRSVDAGFGATLFVEDGYRVKPAENSPLFDDFDNLVDSVIERVLASGGNVLFVRNGSLGKYFQIALILRV